MPSKKTACRCDRSKATKFDEFFSAPRVHIFSVDSRAYVLFLDNPASLINFKLLEAFTPIGKNLSINIKVFLECGEGWPTAHHLVGPSHNTVEGGRNMIYLMRASLDGPAACATVRGQSVSLHSNLSLQVLRFQLAWPRAYGCAGVRRP